MLRKYVGLYASLVWENERYSKQLGGGHVGVINLLSRLYWNLPKVPFQNVLSSKPQ